MKHKLLKSLLLLSALVVGSSSVWADDIVGTINFGSATGSTKIEGKSSSGSGTVTYTDTGDDNLRNTWTITTVTSNSKSFTQNSSYSQVGASSNPVTSITFTTTLPESQTIKAFSAKFGGFNGTAGTITLKVGDTTVGSGSLNAGNDVTVSATNTTTSGTVLTVTVTGIAKGVKCYYISYTYEGIPDPSISADNVTIEDNATSGEIAYTIENPNGSTLTAAKKSGDWISNVAVDAVNNKVTFNTTANTSEASDRTGTITLTYGTVTKDVTVTQWKLVTCTVTITAPSGGTLVVKDGETPIASGSKVRKTTVLTIVATPNSGYRFDGWTANSTAITGNTYTIYQNTTFAATFTEVSSAHTVKFYFNGNQIGSDALLNEGEAIPFPSVPAKTGAKSFVGWATASIATPTDVAPTLVKSASMGTTDVNYYAVYATRTVTTEGSLTKMTSSGTFAANDNVVIVAVVDETHKYALYQETISSSYVKYYSFVADVETIASDEKNFLTVSAGSTTGTGTWKLGDATNGYLYTNSSNNLAVSTTNSSDFVLAYVQNEGFSLKTGGRWLSCRNDLSGDNQYRYRLGGNSSTPSGIGYFDIYKFVAPVVSYSNYSTTIPPATITLASACTDGTNYYGTYSNDCAFVVPEGLTVSTVSVSAGTLILTNYATGDVVKANTGVLVSSTTAGDKTVALSAATGTEKAGNMLKPSGDAGINAASMAAASASGTKFYRLTMHNAATTPPGTLGFYWGAASGAAFDLAANKAYLAVPPAGVKEFYNFDFSEDADGINEVNGSEFMVNGPVYDLQGRRVQKPGKGLYIVNGKKVLF